MEITTERFTELAIAEHNYKKLCRIIRAKADNYESLDNQELRILRDMCCFPTEQGESEEFQCQ